MNFVVIIYREYLYLYLGTLLTQQKKKTLIDSVELFIHNEAAVNNYFAANDRMQKQKPI